MLTPIEYALRLAGQRVVTMPGTLGRTATPGGADGGSGPLATQWRDSRPEAGFNRCRSVAECCRMRSRALLTALLLSALCACGASPFDAVKEGNCCVGMENGPTLQLRRRISRKSSLIGLTMLS